MLAVAFLLFSFGLFKVIRKMSELDLQCVILALFRLLLSGKVQTVRNVMQKFLKKLFFGTILLYFSEKWAGG